MPRDRDVRSAIQAALLGSGYFDAVYTTSLPDFDDQSAEDLRAASILPIDTTQRDEFDDTPAGYLTLDTRVRIVFVVRNQDPQVRDDTVELLLLYAANLLNGQSLASLTSPAFTKFQGGWKWEDPAPPERRIMAIFTYRYIVTGWDRFDTTP